MPDEGLQEIQLRGKQLVFLAMSATVVAVVIFLCGVMVGRGVPTARQAAAEPIEADVLAPVGDSEAAGDRDGRCRWSQPAPRRRRSSIPTSSATSHPADKPLKPSPAAQPFAAENAVARCRDAAPGRAGRGARQDGPRRKPGAPASARASEGQRRHAGGGHGRRGRVPGSGGGLPARGRRRHGARPAGQEGLPGVRDLRIHRGGNVVSRPRRRLRDAQRSPGGRHAAQARRAARALGNTLISGASRAPPPADPCLTTARECPTAWPI